MCSKVIYKLIVFWLQKGGVCGTGKVKLSLFILSPIIKASHDGLIRQFDLYAIITPTYSTHVNCCMPSK